MTLFLSSKLMYQWNRSSLSGQQKLELDGPLCPVSEEDSQINTSMGKCEPQTSTDTP